MFWKVSWFWHSQGPSHIFSFYFCLVCLSQGCFGKCLAFAMLEAICGYSGFDALSNELKCVLRCKLSDCRQIQLKIWSSTFPITFWFTHQFLIFNVTAANIQTNFTVWTLSIPVMTVHLISISGAHLNLFQISASLSSDVMGCWEIQL